MVGFASREAVRTAYDAGQVLRWDGGLGGGNKEADNQCWHFQIASVITDPAATPGVTYSMSAFDPTRPKAIWFPDRSGQEKRLITAGIIGANNIVTEAVVGFYDLLAAVGGIVYAAGGSQTVATQPLPRYATAPDSYQNEVWAVVQTAGATGLGFKLDNYTDGDAGVGAASTSFSNPFQSNSSVGTATQLPMSSTKRGVLSVENVLPSVAAASTMFLMIVRPLFKMTVRDRVYNEVSFIDDIPSMPVIEDGAFIIAMMDTALTTSPSLMVSLQVVYA